MERTIAVAIDPELEAECWAVGKARTNANLGRRDIASYDHKRFHLTGEQNNFLGVIAEVAVILHGDLDINDPGVWNMWVHPQEPDYKKLIQQPDVLNTFEVRHINKPTSPLVVREKDVMADATIVTVYTPHSVYGDELYAADPIIVGWLPAEEAWVKGFKPDWSAGGDRAVPLAMTRPAGSLKAELQRVDAYRLEFNGIVNKKNETN